MIHLLPSAAPASPRSSFVRDYYRHVAITRPFAALKKTATIEMLFTAILRLQPDDIFQFSGIAFTLR
jgi:hypothetical protein